MSFLTRLLLALCVFAGMGVGMVHTVAHDPHDECSAQHSHENGDAHDTHDNGGEKDTPHHHACCHAPSAVSPMERLSTLVAFQPILVEIPTDVVLAPEEPVYALDKPPLI